MPGTLIDACGRYRYATWEPRGGSEAWERRRSAKASREPEGTLRMSIENWSDNIVVVELQDDPPFSDDMTALFDHLEKNPTLDVVLNFTAVKYLNSSNLAKLLKLRKKLQTTKHRLVLCGIDTNVWGLFLVTGLDKVFGFTDSLPTALASVQISSE